MQKRSDLKLGFLVLGIWVATSLYTHWNSWSFDASALYFSAYFYDIGQFDLVFSPEPAFFWGQKPHPEWTELAVSQGADVGDLSPFVYPPLWAAVLAPLASNTTALQFFNLFQVLNSLAIAGSVYLAYGFIQPQRITFSS